MSAKSAPAHGHGHDVSEVELAYPVAHHFDDAEQQHEAAILGMWSFLATEVLFFGGLITAYVIYRTTSPVQVMLASHHLNVPVGAFNTAVLRVSSLLVALSVRAAQLRQHKQVIWLLIGTIALGLVFLIVKYFEWMHDYEIGLMPFVNFQIPEQDKIRMVTEFGLSPDPAVLRRYEMFFVLYFFMTGLHALHLIVGVGIVGTVAYLVHKKRATGGYVNMVEVTGLYWHFIDIVWVFLYPLLYLIDLHHYQHVSFAGH
jgi:cytochrome c oxidase subunit III